MRKPKYFYVVTVLGNHYWINEGGCLPDPEDFIPLIGALIPTTRDKACVDKTKYAGSRILQFENTPPYRFVKEVS